MFNFKHIFIKQHERGLRFKRGDFAGLVGPGRHRVPWFAGLRGIRVEIADMFDVTFKHRHLAVLLKHGDLATALHTLDLKDTQRAIVWKDGRLAWIVGPGRYAFWKTPFDLEFEVFDIAADERFEHPKLDAIRRHVDAGTFLADIEAGPNEELIVFRDGAVTARFRAGRYVHWKTGRATVVKRVDLREQTADVAGQEIMTRDKVTLRVNLVVTSKVLDPLAAVTVVHDWAQALYREAQLALRAAVGGRDLDALLTDKEAVGAELRAALVARAKAFGVEVRSVGLRDIILPGDMKTILNQVITARKQAEANVIRRREETAAARSQANTAKLLADNPVLARVKELEQLQEILAGARTAFVFGRGDLAAQMRTLIEPHEPLA